MPQALSTLPPNSLRTIAKHLNLRNMGRLGVTSKNMAAALDPELKKVWKKEVEVMAREYLRGLEDVMKIYNAFLKWKHHTKNSKWSDNPFTFPTDLHGVVSAVSLSSWSLMYTLQLKEGFLHVNHLHASRYGMNEDITVEFYGRPEKYFDENFIMKYKLDNRSMPPAKWNLSITRHTPHYPSLIPLGIALFMMYAAPKTLKFNTSQIENELERQFTPDELTVWKTKVKASLKS